MESKLLEQALKMPPNERLAFAEIILSSIDTESTEIQKSWITEVKNRMNAVKNGESKLLDFEKLYSAD